ncbi:MAG: DUF4136 domain-containing protein [Erythrobacter sp.]
MRKFPALLTAMGTASLLAGCATIAPPSPFEVTRFHDAAALGLTQNQTQERSVFIASAPGDDGSAGEGSLELASYKRAVAAELASLGYTEKPRRDAAYTAQVSVERFTSQPQTRRRGPVSVGVGGGTGGYGSGVGLGIGINLGGNKNTPRVGTQLFVMMKDRATGNTVWEGRANWDVAEGSELAAADTNAPALANALFSEFPGGNGETVEIKAD